MSQQICFLLIVVLWPMLLPACAEEHQLPSLFNSFEAQQDLLGATPGRAGSRPLVFRSP